MDKILNDILVSREKDNLVQYEEIIQKSLDYMSSIENLDEKKIEKPLAKAFDQWSNRLIVNKIRQCFIQSLTIN